MLNIFIGEMPNVIYDTASYFNHVYLDSWLEEDLSQKILKSVDKRSAVSKSVGCVVFSTKINSFSSAQYMFPKRMRFPVHAGKS